MRPPTRIHAASSVTTRGAAYGYAYDPNGNMTAGPDLTDTVNVVQRNLAFNTPNMPTQVAHPNGGTVNITYDGETKRAKKSGPNGTTYYFSNEFEQIGATELCYVFAGNLRVAMVKDYAYNQVKYFHKDHLGSSSVISNADGTIYEKTRYMPYGGKRGDGAGITYTAYKFTDQELDKESGLYNYDARLYDPVVGRFASADTLVPDWSNSQAFDRFAYAYNDPLKYNDPNGHFAFVAMIAVAVVGAIIHEWADPSTLNAPDVGQKTTKRDSTATTVGKMAVGASAALAMLDMVTPDDSSDNQPKETKNTSPKRTLNDPLPENSKKSTQADPHAPDPDAQGSHTVVGTRTDPKASPEPYRQGITYDEKGNPVGRTDVTDHGRKDHTNPHWHPYDPDMPNKFDPDNPGNFGPAEPMPDSDEETK